MVFVELHHNIVHCQWADVSATLATEAGRNMAKEEFKSDLPLHMAIARRAPEHLILDLIHANPDASMIASQQGNLPLHAAVQNKLPESTIIALIKCFPEALDELNDTQRTPRDYTHPCDKCLEAISRPTACWVEKGERDEYNTSKTRSIENLKNKVQLLKAKIDESELARREMTDDIASTERILLEQDRSQDQMMSIILRVEQKKKSSIVQIEEWKVRLAELKSEILDETDSYEKKKIFSSEKKKHFVRVRKEYEAMLSISEKVRTDIESVKEDIQKCKADQI